MLDQILHLPPLRKVSGARGREFSTEHLHWLPTLRANARGFAYRQLERLPATKADEREPKGLLSFDFGEVLVIPEFLHVQQIASKQTLATVRSWPIWHVRQWLDWFEAKDYLAGSSGEPKSNPSSSFSIAW